MIPVLILFWLYPNLVAQAATDAGPWLTALNLGLAGIGLWAFTTGKIHSNKELQRLAGYHEAEHARLVAKLDTLEGELRERNREARDSLVPTLTKALLLLGRFADRQDNTPPPPTKRFP